MKKNPYNKNGSDEDMVNYYIWEAGYETAITEDAHAQDSHTVNFQQIKITPKFPLGKWIMFLVIFLLLSSLFNPPDNTDKSWLERSGLSLYTDHKTGLQYIKGGICGDTLPRLNEFGKQMKKDDF